MSNADPNIILVTVDSLRGDHCSFLTSNAPDAPNLDALASEGVVFENAIAPGPRTPISMPETLTGALMPALGDCPDEERAHHIADHVTEHTTLPEELASRDYTTAAVNANPWTSSWTGFDDLFDTFVDHTDVTEVSPVVQSLLSVLGGTHAGTMALWASRWFHHRQFFSQWPTLYGDVERLVDTLPEPYFLWIFLMDTHNPYVVPREYREESSTFGMYYNLLRSNSVLTHSGDSALQENMSKRVHRGVLKAYRDSVRSVDSFFGRLHDDIDEEAILAVHSDHGEAFGDHGTYGHHQVLYEENIRVPLVVAGGGEKSGSRVTDPISLRSLTPMLSAVGDGEPIDGRWSEELVTSRTLDGRATAVRGVNKKYVKDDETECFYNLREDPGERRGLSDEEVDDARRYRAKARSFKEAIPEKPPPTVKQSQGLSKSRVKLLEELGYR